MRIIMVYSGRGACVCEAFSFMRMLSNARRVTSLLTCYWDQSSLVPRLSGDEARTCLEIAPAVEK